MATNRCNLRCSYCVLENAHHQLSKELNLNGKKELISHIYHKLDFRRLTLSGGEISIIGKQPPRDFVELLRYIRHFRFTDPLKNLEIEVYTNGRFINESVIQEMKGVVDVVAITIDSIKDSVLRSIGRNHKKLNDYFGHVVQICNFLTKNNIEIRLQSVVFKNNYLSLPEELTFILNTIEKAGGRVSYWKFYQYMSYDLPEKDNIHAIPITLYNQFKERVEKILDGRKMHIHFKDNDEMRGSLFNILSYGNAQYLRANDTWSTSQRTKDLRTYNSMSELFAKHEIDEKLFRQFNEIYR
jgi:sulfatase maturation enzyme AslB (radical SAM superfamily)